MSDVQRKVERWVKLWVISMAKTVGVSNLGLLAVITGLGLVLSWWYAPWLALTAFDHPFLELVFGSYAWWPWVKWITAISIGVFGTWCCLHSICRMIVLSYPETFDETSLI